jgi:hypothetical protein
VLLALGGYRYSAPAGSLSFAPRLEGVTFRTLFTTGSGWGIFERKMSGGKAALTLKLLHGALTLREIGCALPTSGARRPRSARVTVGRATVSATVAVRDGRTFAVLAEAATLRAGETLKVAFG